MQIITTQMELDSFCQRLAGEEFVTIDTEFIREKTYFPNLCLLQIAGEKEAAIIDPLADGIDLAPIFSLLKNSAIRKVFHASRQDVEIFFLLSGEVPQNFYDTQIAAAFCGYGESVGYEALVNKIAGAEVDKSSRYSDWAVRPLSEKQLAYALSDVTHLREIYRHLQGKLAELGREDWVLEEHVPLTKPELYQTEPEDAWKRLRYGNMRPKNLAALRELAKWREIEARSKNLPRSRILKDEVLLEIAAVLPRKAADLGRMRGVDRSISRNYVDNIFTCVDRALAMPASELPNVSRAPRKADNAGAVFAMLQLLIKVKAEHSQIAAPIIASRDDLEGLAGSSAGGDKYSGRLFHGWRYGVFGRDAELMLAGKLKFSINPASKEIIFEHS